MDKQMLSEMVELGKQKERGNRADFSMTDESMSSMYLGEDSEHTLNASIGNLLESA